MKLKTIKNTKIASYIPMILMTNVTTDQTRCVSAKAFLNGVTILQSIQISRTIQILHTQCVPLHQLLYNKDTKDFNPFKGPKDQIKLL